MSTYCFFYKVSVHFKQSRDGLAITCLGSDFKSSDIRKGNSFVGAMTVSICRLLSLLNCLVHRTIPAFTPCYPAGNSSAHDRSYSLLYKSHLDTSLLF